MSLLSTQSGVRDRQESSDRPARPVVVIARSFNAAGGVREKESEDERTPRCSRVPRSRLVRELRAQCGV